MHLHLSWNLISRVTDGYINSRWKVTSRRKWYFSFHSLVRHVGCHRELFTNRTTALDDKLARDEINLYDIGSKRTIELNSFRAPFGGDPIRSFCPAQRYFKIDRVDLPRWVSRSKLLDRRLLGYRLAQLTNKFAREDHLFEYIRPLRPLPYRSYSAISVNLDSWFLRGNLTYPFRNFQTDIVKATNVAIGRFVRHPILRIDAHHLRNCYSM